MLTDVRIFVREKTVRRSPANGEFRQFPTAGTAAIIALFAMTAAGCARSPRASMAHMWDRVPPLRWPSGAEESQAIEHAPQVTANVAVAAPPDALDSEAEGPGYESSSDAWPSSPVVSNDVNPGANPEIDPFEPEGPVSAELSIDQRMQELKAALTNDAELGFSARETLSELHPFRLRVDGLLRRSNDFLAAGELGDARRTAQLAADLSAAASLEFLPNEERPSDLLRQIEERIAATITAPGETVEDRLSDVGAPAPPRAPIEIQPGTASISPAVPSATGAGKVAANFPLSARQPAVEDDAIAKDTVAAPELPSADPFALSFAIAPSADAPIAMDRDPPWTLPQLDAIPPSPTVAPKPPIVDEIAPLPRFRAPAASPILPASAAVANRGSLHWMDWVPLGALGMLLSICGLALGWRRWRQGG